MIALACLGIFVLGVLAGYALRQLTGRWSFDSAYERGVQDEQDRWLGRGS